MSTRTSIKLIKTQFPKVKPFAKQKLKTDIFKYLNFFVEDEKILLSSLIQNPFGKTENLAEIKKNFGRDIEKIILTLNRLQSLDKSIINEYGKHKKIIVLYLVNYKFIFERKNRYKETKSMINRKRILYAMSLLERIDISEIRTVLEDVFFSYLKPGIYKNYQSLLKFTRKKYLVRQEEIIKHFERLLSRNGIQPQIQARIKSIFSIHNKIIKKNILFSQVLDTIGLRILVNNKEECYKSMAVILHDSPIMNSRIKDYIAVPKENGYQSIHLTIIYEGFPVEIQIRTFKMHSDAQYGNASHLIYKNGHE